MIRDAPVGIYDIRGNMVDEVNITLKKQFPANNDCYASGFNYADSFNYSVPRGLKSGIYLVANKIPFLVKNSLRNGEIVVVYPSNTEAAYNEAGGRSLYTVPQKTGIVSFKRPSKIAESAEGFLKWVWNSGYRIDYISDADLENPASFNYASVVIIAGHNEYWSRKARMNFDDYADHGGNALILSGNTMWWQVRYNSDQSQLICYKDSTLDPSPDELVKTVTWNTPSLQYPIYQSTGTEFSRGGYGLKNDNGWNGYQVIEGNSPLLAGTSCKKGDIIFCKTDEYDGAPVILDPLMKKPVWDTTVINFYRKEIIGYDIGFRSGPTIPTFIVFQKTPHSGIVINTASSDWCSEENFSGINGMKLQVITSNAMYLLLQKKNVFSH